jgi:prolyl 4-hydroxylase
VGERNPDGSYGSVQSSGRTSTNAWCSETCLTNETVKGVIQKLENLTGIPDANSEQLQLLRYEVSQHYNSHHDFIDHDVGRRAGPRILTVFLYLNDVEAGGATHFTDLDIAVYPKKGRVLLWPSVLDQDPNGQDYRTHHQAMPVEAGIKYGANAWVRRKEATMRTPGPRLLWRSPEQVSCGIERGNAIVARANTIWLILSLCCFVVSLFRFRSTSATSRRPTQTGAPEGAVDDGGAGAPSSGAARRPPSRTALRRFRLFAPVATGLAKTGASND